MKKLLYTIALCLFTSTLAFAQTNLVSNPGFENVTDGVPDGWTTSDASSTISITSASDMFYKGSKSLKVNISDDGSTALVYQYVAVKQGKQYDLSVWANIASESAEGATRVYLDYDFVDANGTSLNMTNSSRYSYTLNQWGQITIQTVEVPANAAYLMFQFRGRRTLTAYIDNASVTEVGAVSKQDQTISGLSNLDKTVGDADFDLSATASSGLAVSYSSSNTAVATISGNTVHIVGAGTTTITASQAGNDTYNAATPVTATLTVNAASTSKNLVTNPGFETVNEDGTPAGWTNLSTTLAIEVVSDTVYAGSNSLRVSTTDYTGEYLVAYIPVTAGKTYNLSAWCNLQSYTGTSSARTKMGLVYTYVDGNGNTLDAAGNTLGGDITSTNLGSTSIPAMTSAKNTWQQLSLTTSEVAPSNAAYIVLALNAARVTAYFDNVSVTEAGSVGINETTADQKSVLPVRKDGDNLIVTTHAGSSIEVYSILGVKLQSKVAKEDETVIGGLPKGQMLVVRSGKAVAKVVL